MSIEGDRLSISNRNGAQAAAVITQAAGSTQPALALGGDLVVTGAVNGVTGPRGAPGVGQIPVATSPTTTANQSPMNVGGWVFDIRAYGAVGDGQIAADGAIASGTPNLACPSKPFTAADKGKAVLVLHAAAAGITTLATTISKVVDSGHVTLAANAGAAVASGGVVLWATDDTAAIQKAINAGHAFATAFTAPNVAAQPLYQAYSPPGAGAFYGVAGPLVTGGATLGNGQITIPVEPDTANGVTCQIVGVDSGAKTRHWNQGVPQMSGSTWVSFGVFASAGAQIASANAAGTPAMISGPTGVNGYGTDALLYSNVTVHLRNMSLLTTHSANGLGYGALNLHGCARAVLEDVSYGTAGTVPGGDYSTPAGFSNGLSIGALMPANGNNALNIWHRVICQGGYTYGVYATEHMHIDESVILYCWSGFCPVGSYGDGGSGVGALHAVDFPLLAIEGCTQIIRIIGPGSGGFGPVLRGRLDTEGNNAFDDTTSGTALAAALGEICLSGSGNTISSTSGTSLQIVNDLQAPGFAATPTYTLSAAQINSYWRWATVILNGGVVTSVQVSSLMGGASAPAMNTVWTGALSAPITVRIPPGAWWQINGSVKPTVNTWMLD